MLCVLRLVVFITDTKEVMHYDDAEIARKPGRFCYKPMAGRMGLE
jgi:hypothetical protein